MKQAPNQTTDTLSFFAAQMTIHFTRILAANGLEDRLKSAIRQTLADGIEQFQLSDHEQLKSLAAVFRSAVDGGVQDRKEWAEK